MSATRTNLTGEAARGTETRPAEATFARRTTNQQRDNPSHKNFSAEQEMLDRKQDYFKQN
jgi:hypothetical protein